jgi:uncharacterized membrane protein
MKAFGIGESISFGWKTFKSNAGLLIGVMLVSGIIGYVPTALDNMQKNGQMDLGLFALVLSIAFFFISQLLELGMVFINVQLVDGKKATFNDLFSQTSVLIKGVLAALLYGVIVLLGIICFIIPGIWLAIRLQFYKYLVVDKKMGPIEALKGSWNMTKGNVWNLIGLGLVIMLLNLLGLIALIIGIFVTAPISMVAMAYVYRKLSANLK